MRLKKRLKRERKQKDIMIMNKVIWKRILAVPKNVSTFAALVKSRNQITIDDFWPSNIWNFQLKKDAKAENSQSSNGKNTIPLFWFNLALFHLFCAMIDKHRLDVVVVLHTKSHRVNK